MMNIVIISEFSARELYIIEHVLKKYPSATVVRPTYSSESSPSDNLKKVKLPKMSTWAKASYWKLQCKLWDNKFYPENKYPDISNFLEVPEPDLHRPAGIETIKVLSPDILITCRAPILTPELIEIPNKAAVNIHYGIAPYYRGNDTLFWSLYHNDFKNVGGCIHHLTEGVDTGNILAEVYPALNPDDGEIDVDYKTSDLLAVALLKFLETAEKNSANLSGKSQIKKGRNFKSDERTFLKSVEYLLKRGVGLSRPPKRNSRIVTYFSSNADGNPTHRQKPDFQSHENLV